MPEKVDDIHDALIDDPDFKPQAGSTKDESAWAVAYSKKSIDLNNILKNITKEDIQTIAIDIVKQLENNAAAAARARGLVPKTGDWNKPGRWVRSGGTGGGDYYPGEEKVPAGKKLLPSIQTKIDEYSKNGKTIAVGMPQAKTIESYLQHEGKNPVLEQRADGQVLVRPSTTQGNITDSQWTPPRLQKTAKDEAQAKGLVPQSGDEEHPGRWIKPETQKKKAQSKNKSLFRHGY